MQRQPARSQRLWAPAWHSALTWLWHKLRRQDEAASLSCHSCFAAKNVVLFWRRLLTLLLQCSWFHVIHMHRPVMFVSICEHTPHTHTHTHTLRNFTHWTSHAAQVWQCFWGRGKLTSSQLSHHRYDNTAIIYVEKMYCYTGVNKSKCNIYIIVYIYIYYTCMLRSRTQKCSCVMIVFLQTLLANPTVSSLLACTWSGKNMPRKMTCSCDWQWFIVL